MTDLGGLADRRIGRRRRRCRSTLRVALTSSMTRATATLNRWPSTQSARCRPAAGGSRGAAPTSPVAGSVPGALVDVDGQPVAPAAGTSASRRARRRPSRCPPPADRRRPRSAGSASTPNASICAPRSTPLPSDLLIDLPWLITWPWFSSRLHRLDEVDHAHVVQHLGEEPHVQQVQDRVLDAADVLRHRHPAPDVVGIERAVGVARASSSGRSTRTSRRRCPSCRCPAWPGRRTCGQSTFTQSVAAASGEVPFGARSAPRQVGQLDRQLVVGHRHLAAGGAVDDRDRAAPVALPAQQPVPQPEGDRALADAVVLQLGDDRARPRRPCRSARPADRS